MGVTVSIRPKSQMILKNKTFRMASCLARYLVCESAGQAVKMWAMPSGTVPHSLLAKSLLSLTGVVWMVYNCVDYSCS